MQSPPIPEQHLPSNPNCVSVTTDAARVLSGRTWAELEQLAVRVVEPFHRASGIACLGGYAWRVALSRKNERLTQVQLYFVFDGPATRAHLDTLERGVIDLDLGFGPACVERVPINGAPAVLATGGRLYGVLHVDPPTGEPCMRQLELRDGRIGVRIVPASRVGGDPTLHHPSLALALGAPAPYGPAEQEAERMRLAFAQVFTERIIQADGVVREGETTFVTTLFPAELVHRLGIEEPAVRDEYFASACELLPVQLGHHDKLALIGLFFSACYSDGSLDAREMRILKEAGEALGLTRDEVVKYLRRFW